MDKFLLFICACMFASANAYAAEDDIITFADPEVERICVDNWDFNEDGKISYKEAGGIRSIGMVFAKNVDITSFNEFKYFKNVKYTEEFAFEACVSLTDITMPESMEALDKGSFCDCSSLTNVQLNEGIKYIGEGCFANCGGIEHIDIPETVEDLGASAFHKCTSLLSIKIPKPIEYLPVELFNNCSSLETVVLQEGLKGMGNSVFNECFNLKSISLPSTFKSFGMWVFWDCYSVEKYDVAEENPYFTSVDGVLYSKDLKTLVQYPAGSTVKDFIVPEGTETVGFASCEGAINLEKVTIPASVKKLDGASLYKCDNLKEIKLNEGLEEIGNEAFYNCLNLSAPVLPQSIKTIGSGAFTGCESFVNVVIPEKVTYIDFRLFYNCYSLETVKFSQNVNTIDQEAFSGCVSLKSIDLPKSLQYIGPIAFKNCNKMNEIYVYLTKPFIAGAEISQLLPSDDNGNILDNERIVYVPKGYKTTFEADNFWKNAKEIREFNADDTSVDAAVAGGKIININGNDMYVNDGVVNIYTIDGRLYGSVSDNNSTIVIPSGIYIVNDKKIVVR